MKHQGLAQKSKHRERKSLGKKPPRSGGKNLKHQGLAQKSRYRVRKSLAAPRKAEYHSTLQRGYARTARESQP